MTRSVHEMIHSLLKLHKRLLVAREICTQPAVLAEIDGMILDVCSIGDKLATKKGEKQ